MRCIDDSVTLGHYKIIQCPFYYKDHLSRYGNTHYKYKNTDLLNGNSYTDEMVFLYWNCLQVPRVSPCFPAHFVLGSSNIELSVVFINRTTDWWGLPELSTFITACPLKYEHHNSDVTISIMAIKSQVTGPLWGESTSDWWIPLTKGQ